MLVLTFAAVVQYDSFTVHKKGVKQKHSIWVSLIKLHFIQ